MAGDKKRLWYIEPNTFKALYYDGSAKSYEFISKILRDENIKNSKGQNSAIVVSLQPAASTSVGDAMEYRLLATQEALRNKFKPSQLGDVLKASSSPYPWLSATPVKTTIQKEPALGQKIIFSKVSFRIPWNESLSKKSGDGSTLTFGVNKNEHIISFGLTDKDRLEFLIKGLNPPITSITDLEHYFGTTSLYETYHFIFNTTPDQLSPALTDQNNLTLFDAFILKTYLHGRIKNISLYDLANAKVIVTDNDLTAGMSRGGFSSYYTIFLFPDGDQSTMIPIDFLNASKEDIESLLASLVFE